MALDRINATALLDGGVTTADIADDAVTTAKLATQTGNVDFADGGRIRLGDSQDLQIYHDGSDSYVRDNGTGDLYIEGSDDIRFRTTSGQTYAVFNENASVNLYHNDTLKFETTATGVDVTGALTTTSGATIAGGDLLLDGGSPEIIFQTAASHYNWMVAAQENVSNALEISSGSQDGDYSNDTWTPRLVVTSDGNVGIGVTPSELLHIDNASGDAAVRIDGSTRSFKIEQNNYGLRFVDVSAASAERMRITAGGDLLVGGTSLGENGAVTMGGDGRIYAIRASDTAGFFGRTSTNGNIVNFTKDGSTVGSIGSNGGSPNRLFIACNDTGLDFESNTDAIRPCSGAGGARDDVIDLGRPDVRFDDIYATNGTIQTSDANEKQQIAELTDAEITAAKAISALFKTFKWNKAVTEKGDAARTHAGVIAQDVQAAMTAAGLDAGDYAFFISSTWWETQTEVPAVEADEENGVEAQEAYTRTDTYDTAEEAPDGATERTRMGIRYPELLAFVGAATEQRLGNIETRLEALENA